MQPRPSFDELFVNEVLRASLEEALPGAQRPEVAALQVLAHDGAVERLLQKAHAALAKNSSDQKALLDWAKYFSLYLDMKLPKSKHLDKEPLGFLVSILDQADKGSLHPILKNPVHSRPTDSTAKLEFKIRCVLAADLMARKGPGASSSGLNRQEADQRISSDKRVKRVAEKFGISFKKTTIRDWRRDIKKAHQGEPLEMGYRIYSRYAVPIMAEVGLDAAVGWLLNRIADPMHIA